VQHRLLMLLVLVHLDAALLSRCWHPMLLTLAPALDYAVAH
jgi:hypothetical protein